MQTNKMHNTKEAVPVKLKTGISVVLLAYEEEENLKILLPQIKSIMEELCTANDNIESYEILVIDSAEPLDNTKQVCQTHGARYINQEEPRFGGAFRTGIKYAEYDKFLILDSDCSHDPIYMPAIYKKFTEENYDIVIGSRYTEGGVNNDSTQSVFMSKTLNLIYSIALGIKVKDISTDYRMYNTQQLKAVKLKCKNYDVLQEVLLMLSKNKKDLKIGEVPITFQKRQYGVTKRRLFIQIMAYLRTLVRLTLIKLMR